MTGVQATSPAPHEARSWRMIAQTRSQGFAPRQTGSVARQSSVQAPQTTGGISPLLRRVWPDFPLSPPQYRGVIARKTRRITWEVPPTGPLQIMWPPAQSCGPRGHHCEPEASARVNDCGPESLHYCEPDALPLQAATVTFVPLAWCALFSWRRPGLLSLSPTERRPGPPA
jgi:hypothetical protein